MAILNSILEPSFFRDRNLTQFSADERVHAAARRQHGGATSGAYVHQTSYVLDRHWQILAGMY